MRQRQANDPEVQDTKSLDWSGRDSKLPSTVMSDESANIAEARDERAFIQFESDFPAPV
jgi:hypothetical protein